MDRQLSDKSRKTSDHSRLREFLRLERGAGRHPALDVLHRMPRGGSGRRLAEYARIERGRTV